MEAGVSQTASVTALKERIASRRAEIVVVGGGYVGLPLAVEAASAGYRTVVFDKNPDKIRAINASSSYVKGIANETLRPLVAAGKLAGSTDADVLGGGDAIIVCVPTPLNKTRDPDNSFIIDAADMIVTRMRPPQLVVLESTTFPGFTRELLLPKLASSGFALDQDFFVAFSPERVDPGNARYGVRNTPKVLGGSTPASLDLAATLYATFIERVVPVSSTDTAEMVKLLENTFRAVNIGLVNEVAIMCQRLGLNVWEVIDAAASKPFGFMPFFPGPGLGGHCIPIDPLYLSWKLKTLHYTARFIALADEVNSSMPEFVVMRVADALNERRKAVSASRILICGVTYKRDIDDVRESPAFDIIDLLQRRHAQVDYHDPHVPELRLGGATLHSVPLERAGVYDCVVIVTDHAQVDYAALVERAQLVVDCRNATRGHGGDNRATKVVTL
jgi:UDP-N-acetyl-D-glucosamine dehydrogenase